MAQNDDFIVVRIDGNEDEVVILQRSEDTDSSSTDEDVVTILVNIEDDEEMAQSKYPENFKRNNPDSEEERLRSLHKKTRPSPSHDYKGDCNQPFPVHMERNHAQTNLLGASLQSAASAERKQPVCELKEEAVSGNPELEMQKVVIRVKEENLKEQEGIVRVEEEIHKVEEKVLMVRELTVMMEESAHTVEEPIRPVEEHILWEQNPFLRVGKHSVKKPVLIKEEQDEDERKNQYNPYILSSHSLQPYLTASHLYPYLTLMSYFCNENTEYNPSHISSAQSIAAMPTAILPPRASRLEDDYGRINCSNALEGVTGNLDWSLSSLYLSPTCGIVGQEGTSEQDHAMRMNNQTSVEPDFDSGVSSACIILSDENEDTSLPNNPETMNYPVCMIDNNGRTIDVSSDVISSNGGNGSNSLQSNPQTMNYPGCHGRYIDVSSDIISSNGENEGTSLQSNPQTINYPAYIGRFIDLSSDVISSNGENEGTSLQSNPQTVIHSGSNWRDIDVSSDVIASHGENQGTGLLNNPQTMSYPAYNGRFSDVSSDVICINGENEGTGLQNNPQTMSHPAYNGRFIDLSSDVISINDENEGTGLQNNPQTMSYPAYNGRFIDLSPDVISIINDGNEGTSLQSNLQTMNYPAYNGRFIDLSSDVIPSNSENEDTSLPNNPETMNYPTCMIDNNGRTTDVSSDVISSNGEMLDESETMEAYSARPNCPLLLSNGQDLTPTSLSVRLNLDMTLELNYEALNKLGMLENENNQQTAVSSLLHNPCYVLVPVDVRVKANTSIKNDSETINNASSLLDNNQGPSSSDDGPPPNFGYLGNPLRNVQMLITHLVKAKNKGKPKYAARYLFHYLFSKETLIDSSVGVDSQDLQSLDPNKVAAIREYLEANFPSYDLRECGKEWKNCVSDLTHVIYSLRRQATESQKTHGHIDNKPVNIRMPASVDPRNGVESSSQTAHQTAAPAVVQGCGNSLWASSAAPKEIGSHAADRLSIDFDAVEYFGNPNRNIKMPCAVLDSARLKTCPELSARYLIRNLFTDDVLMKSNVNGHCGYGIFALDSNRIGALREFLQDTFPTYDLSEVGDNWKLCVAAINSTIRSLRHDKKLAAAMSQQNLQTTGEEEPKPSDHDSNN